MQRTAKALVAGLALAAAAWSQTAAVPGQGTWETTLQVRDLDGDGSADADCDTTLDISGLADADVIGQVTFAQAASWVAGLNVAGVTSWRLPTLRIDSCGTDGEPRSGTAAACAATACRRTPRTWWTGTLSRWAMSACPARSTPR